MLILTRKPGQSFKVDLGDIDPRTPIGEVFADGPIEILVTVVKGRQVRLGIQASLGFSIMRSELVQITEALRSKSFVGALARK